MSLRPPVVALAGALALLSGCGGSAGSTGSIQNTRTGAPGGGHVRACPPHRGLRLSVAGMSCAAGGALADAMGPSSARARFSVNGFDCSRPPGGDVRCTHGASVLELSGGD